VPDVRSEQREMVMVMVMVVVMTMAMVAVLQLASPAKQHRLLPLPSGHMLRQHERVRRRHEVQGGAVGSHHVQAASHERFNRRATAKPVAAGHWHEEEEEEEGEMEREGREGRDR
jgi:hypothetical protein